MGQFMHGLYPEVAAIRRLPIVIDLDQIESANIVLQSADLATYWLHSLCL